MIRRPTLLLAAGELGRIFVFLPDEPDPGKKLPGFLTAWFRGMRLILIGAIEMFSRIVL